MEEIWKDIKGYEGKYQVSSEGRVKTLDYKRTHKEQILTPYLANIKGHKKFKIGLSQNGRSKSYSIHRLVVKAFPEICGDLKKGYDVHHKDHNPLNNSASNLECLSKSEHAIKHQSGNRLPHGIKWTKQQFLKFKKSRQIHIIQMDLDGNEIIGWFSASLCEEETHYSKSAICRCCKNIQKTAYGFKWRYAS